MLITLSAPYGTGGSIVAPALAESLGVPFLQRVTTPAGRVATPEECRERLSGHEAKLTPVHRFVASLTQAMPVGSTLCPPSTHHQDEELRRSAEAELCSFIEAGGGVILGHAAAVVLGKDCGYHVRLDGSPARRLEQGAALEAVSHDQAQVHMKAADQARNSLVRRLYRVDPADPSLYHLVIDSTVISLDAVVDLILTAVRCQPVA
jgi:cytidylate kinase